MGLFTLSKGAFCGLEATFQAELHGLVLEGQFYVFAFKVAKTYGRFTRATYFGGRFSTTLVAGGVAFGVERFGLFTIG